MNWKIEQFHFSESRRTLTAGSQVEALEPLVCAVLVHLCRHPDEVVTRDALVDAVWRGRVVTDNAVNRVIVKLRSAFGDDARNPKFIVTQSKTGYRLIAPVEIIRPHTSAGLSTARYKVVGVALVIATMIGLSTVLWHQSTGPVARSAAPLYRGGSDEYGPVVSPDGRLWPIRPLRKINFACICGIYAAAKPGGSTMTLVIAAVHPGLVTAAAWFICIPKHSAANSGKLPFPGSLAVNRKRCTIVRWEALAWLFMAIRATNSTTRKRQTGESPILYLNWISNPVIAADYFSPCRCCVAIRSSTFTLIEMHC